MSQIGIEGIREDVDNGLNHTLREFPVDLTKFDRESEFSDQNLTVQRVTILFAFSVIGLLGNFLTILMVIITKQLRKPHNSFFVHHCVLDAVKSAYCFVFGKSLLSGEPPDDCAILGASYIVFVTTSSFNILAITINEIYYFTNEIVGVQPNSKCCVLFGVGITWFASIIINLGVAFLPGNPTYDRTVGYCTFMYGVTGNYLLHILWIVLISLALLLTIVYLRKFWIDIRKRAYFRIAAFFHNTMQLQIEHNSMSEKTRLKEKYIRESIGVGKKNFFLLVIMTVTFAVFWYPLFILTLADPLFKADPVFYKTLTIVAWCHSSLTPVFFFAYNINSMKDIQEKIIWKSARDVSSHSLTSHSQRICHLTSDSESTPCSPQRPNSLNVTPVYMCQHHISSGVCIEGGCSSSKRNIFTSPRLSLPNANHMRVKTPLQTASAKRRSSALEHRSLKDSSISKKETNEDPWIQQEDLRETDDWPKNETSRIEMHGWKKGETTTKIDHHTKECNEKSPLLHDSREDNSNITRQQIFPRSLSIPISIAKPVMARYKTTPARLTTTFLGSDQCPGSNGEVQVEERTTPPNFLTVHSLSTGCMASVGEGDYQLEKQYWV